jgi:hypothetical protein
MPWPISKARKWRKFNKELYGRRKPDGWTPNPVVQPAYRRPSLDERFVMWRWAAQGLSARAVARRLGRDHHTVRRHLDPERGALLAVDLAIHGKRGAAREMVRHLGDAAAVSANVEDCLATFEAWVTWEQARIDRIANACLTRSTA